MVAGARKLNRSGTSRKGAEKGSGDTMQLNTGAAVDPASGAGDVADTPAGVEEVTATGRRKRKDTGAVREKARAWSQDEEMLFLEALELHGRQLHWTRSMLMCLLQRA